MGKDARSETMRTQRFYSWVTPFLMAAVFFSLACAPSESQRPSEVTVSLSEFTIQATQTDFSAGAEYRFIIKNEGQAPHEWMVMPPGQTDHMGALKMVDERSLAPGRSVTLSYSFSGSGEFEFACHLPGHYEGGMKLPIRVS